jgi:hypothetical protein
MEQPESCWQQNNNLVGKTTEQIIPLVFIATACRSRVSAARGSPHALRLDSYPLQARPQYNDGPGEAAGIHRD